MFYLALIILFSFTAYMQILINHKREVLRVLYMIDNYKVKKYYDDFYKWKDTQGETYETLNNMYKRLVLINKKINLLKKENQKTVSLVKTKKILREIKDNMKLLEQSFSELNDMKKDIHTFIKNIKKQDIIHVEQVKLINLLKAYEDLDIIRGHSVLKNLINSDNNLTSNQQMII